MALQIGQPAPAFTLYDTTKKQVSLSEQEGKNVLLLFFPQAFTSVCTAELCSIRDNIAIYGNLNAQVFGISVDSVYTLAKYSAEQNFNFPLLSDFNKEASNAYEALYDIWNMGMKGVSKRAAFLIDKKGLLQYIEVLENAKEQPDFEAIQQKLAELR